MDTKVDEAWTRAFRLEKEKSGKWGKIETEPRYLTTLKSQTASNKDSNRPKSIM